MDYLFHFRMVYVSRGQAPGREGRPAPTDGSRDAGGVGIDSYLRSAKSSGVRTVTPSSAALTAFELGLPPADGAATRMDVFALTLLPARPPACACSF